MSANTLTSRSKGRDQERPWERQPGEPDKAYSKFGFYLQLGSGRTLGKVADAFGISEGRVRELSARWRWAVRAAAWDAEAVRRRREEEMRQTEQAQQRHLRDAVDWQRLAGTYVMSWVRRNEGGEFELTRDLTSREALRLWRVGYRAERLLRGGSADRAANESVHEDLVLEAEVDELRRAARRIVENEFIPRGLRDIPVARLRAERLLVRLAASIAGQRRGTVPRLESAHEDDKT